MRVAVFNLGGAIKFRENHIKRSDGTSEYYKLIWALARMPDVKRVVILSSNDWKKTPASRRLFTDPHRKVVDAWDGVENFCDADRSRPPEEQLEKTKQIAAALAKNVGGRIDWGIGFCAPGYEVSSAIPGFMKSVRFPDRYARQLLMTLNFCSSTLWLLNEQNFPWFMIVTDPRYLKKTIGKRDTWNLPRRILSQHESTRKWIHIERFERDAPVTESTVKVEYTGIERLNLIGEEPTPPDVDRPVKFSVVAMQSVTSDAPVESDKRYSALREWVIDQDPKGETAIYGKWDERFTRGFPQFKGFIPASEVDNIFRRTRYTLIIPIRPGWVTSKYAEMLLHGCLPFFHPTYDEQHNVLPADHFLRVSTPRELHKKMRFLDKNPELRVKLVRELQEKFVKPGVTGEFLRDLLNESFEVAGLGFRLRTGVETNATGAIPTLESLLEAG